MRYSTNSAGGIATSLLYLLSPMLIRMMFDLIKNAMGLTFLAFTLLFSYLTLRYRKLSYSVLASLFIVLTGLTHILDFGVTYAVILFLLVFTIISNRKELKYLILPFAASTVILMLGFTYYSLMGGDPYKGIAFVEAMLKQLQHPLVMLSSVSAAIYSLAISTAGILLVLMRKNFREVDCRFILFISLVLMRLTYH